MSRPTSPTSEMSDEDARSSGGDDGTIIIDENRRYCTILYNELQNLAKQQIPDVKEIIDEELKDLQKLQEQYNAKSIEAELDQNVNIGEREAFQTLFRELRNGLLLKKSSISVATQEEKGLKLPKISVPRFSGRREDWLTFRNIFTTLIHNNTTINSIQKHGYLAASLDGDALNLVKNLNISEGNYEKCWQIILQHYDDPFQQVAAHLSAIQNQPGMDKKTSLRQLVANFQQNYAAFQSIIAENNFDAVSQILINWFLAKTNSEIRNDWEKELANKKRFCDFAEFLEFMDARASAIERATANTSTTKHVMAAIAVGKYCQFCKRAIGHFIHNCEKFLKLLPTERNSFIRKQRLCARCLRRKCNASCGKFTCKICRRDHNTLIHCERSSSVQNSTLATQRPPTTITTDNEIDAEEPPPNKKPKGNNIDNVNCSSYSDISSSSLKLLRTFGAFATTESLLTTISCKIGPHECKALLDSGSQFSFITENLCRQLNIQGDNVGYHIQAIDGLMTKAFQEVTIQIQSLHSRYKLTINCLIIPKIVEYLPSNYFSIESWNIPTQLQLADPTFNIPSQIELLIGSNEFWKILGNSKYMLGKNLPELRDTKFGWIVTGKASQSIQQNGICTLTINQNLEICRLLERFWDVEELQYESKSWTTEERECEKLFLQTIKRQPDGRFVVQLPFKTSPDTTLGESRQLALKRFAYLENKLNKNEQLKEMYSSCLEEYITLGHMTEFTSTPGQVEYYIPHHAVIKESSTTTKLRTVFDAGMKTTTNISLNDIQMVGPVVQSELIAIMLRFRTRKFVFSTDITKMYRQIRVTEEHTRYQLILWRKTSTEPIKTYALQTVTFGVASSPYLATRCLKYLAETQRDNFPAACPSLLNDTYVDDILTGANKIEEAILIQEQLIALLESAHLPLNKWCSNDSRLLSNIPEHLQEKHTTLALGGETGITTLGMIWLPKSDELSIKIKINLDSTTKREVLSSISAVYDPLGLCGPVIVKGKILMQSIWSATIENKHICWDDVLPDEILAQWRTFISQIQLLQELKFSRYLFSQNEMILCELHGFADASEKAYGAVVYSRSIDETGLVTTRVVASKSRVAPLKRKSIPRLELCAALLLAELINKIHEILFNLHITNVRLWSDSTITLCWLNTPSYKLETYEANRVQKVQTLTRNFLWDHVESQQNPADLVSRGLNAEQLMQSQLWWEGPEWLKTNTEPWSRDIKFNSTNNSKLGLKKIRPVVGSVVSTNTIFERYSKYNKLVRITAYMMRFCINAQVGQYTIHKEGPKLSGSLKRSEIYNASLILARRAQQESFGTHIRALKNPNDETSSEYLKKSSITPLNPYLDNQGILRVGGRLEASCLSYDEKHPIILDRHHILTQLIIRHEHEKHLHATPQLLTNILRRQFWIPRCHTAIQTCIRKCVTCLRFKATTQQQIMANLPKSRVTPNKPFHITGVDYVGPVNVKCHGGRNKVIFKAYIALFVCFSTKAVHLELVANLSSEAFLNALRRFTARRGIPNEIHSDNGRTFTGAKPLLDAKFKGFIKENRTKILDFASSEGINWYFIPPYAPHWGGIWESNIKSMKKHLRTTTYDSHYNFEELTTLLCQVEAILNSRPLTPLTNDPNSLEVLTPAHFLIGSPITALPEIDYTTKSESRLLYWQQIQRKTQNFWKRWSAEYLNTLQQRTKWRTNSRNLEVGDLVLIKDDNVPPTDWIKGRVTTLHVGKDHNVRLVTLKTIRGSIERPISKLIYLPVN